MTSRAPAPGASDGDRGTSEATPLPVASQEILRSLNCTIVGFEDPKSGKLALGMQFVLPPLTPGAPKYYEQLAPYLSRLGQAVAKGRVFILDDTLANSLSASFNWSEGELRAGWAQMGVFASLLLLAKVLTYQVTVPEAVRIATGIQAEPGLGDHVLRPAVASTLYELTDADRAQLPALEQRIRRAVQILAPSIEEYRVKGDDPAALWSVEDLGYDLTRAYDELQTALEQLNAAIAAGAATIPLHLVDDVDARPN